MKEACRECAEVCNGRDDDANGAVDDGATRPAMDTVANSPCMDGACRIVSCAGVRPTFALRFTETTQRDLVARRIGEVHWAMYASKEYVARRDVPSPITNLVGHDVVAFEDTPAGVPGAKWLAEHAKGAAVAFRGSSLRSVLEATMTGMGITVLPCQLADPEEQLQRLSPEVLGSRTLSLVVRPGPLEGRSRARGDGILGRDRRAGQGVPPGLTAYSTLTRRLPRRTGHQTELMQQRKSVRHA